jgi:uncharacterized protein (TIGR03437 family)
MGALAASAQISAPEWRHIGNSALELSLASAATGPVDRVWRSADGATLFARTSDGRVFETADFENWKRSAEAPPDRTPPSAQQGPEARAFVTAADGRRDRLYAAGTNAYKSDDGGAHWDNLTDWQGQSILGGPLADISISRSDPNDIVVAGATGIWRSLDAGLTWTGLNTSLPNLPVSRLLAVPNGLQPLRIGIRGGEAEWRTGVKTGWLPVDDAESRNDQARRRSLGEALGAEITAAATVGDAIYAGASDGRLFASLNAGRSWNRFPFAEQGSVEALYVDPRDPMYALAAINVKQRGHVLRTVNGGVYWDEIADSTLAPVHGVAADRASGTVYAATSKGVWMAYAATPWVSISSGLPDAPAVDVKLNDGGHQLYVALAGYGVYGSVAPHRARDPKLVSAGDLAQRSAAPGALLTVVGRTVENARTGDRSIPVLARSQVQIPFDASGTRIAVVLDSSVGSSTHTLALQSASPAIFVDADGTPLITDADTGLLLDGSTPVRPGTRLQIFATGLGRVRPDWPAGIPAPLQDVPQVIAPVRVLLDREPLDVTRATLAPGYVGLYLIEVELSSVLNDGTAELLLEVDGQVSNRVKLYVERS